MTQSHIKPVYKTAYLGLMLAGCLILGYIESLIPLSFGIPGIKLGLSNLPVLLCLYILGPGASMILCIMKALLTSILFGNLFSAVYSLAGAVLSCLVMIALFRTSRLHIISISCTGGVFHNLGQLIIAVFVTGSKNILYYGAFLFPAGLVTGFLIGLTGFILLPYIKRVILKEKSIDSLC